MKIKYVPPVSSILGVVQRRVICASFHDTDHTENWTVEDEETI